MMCKSLIYAIADCQLKRGRIDHIAEQLGVPAAKFTHTYENDVKNMKLNLLKYVKALQNIQS